MANSEVHVFSPSAMHSSLDELAARHREQSGTAVSLAFETAPAFRKRLDAGQKADVLIAPPPLMDELVATGKARAENIFELGRVGVGVVVREGAPLPDISDVEAFKRSLLDAESIVYNRASSGMYVEKLIANLGVAHALAPKTKRYHDAQGAFTHLRSGSGYEIGFGGLTEIVRWRDKGLLLVGALPSDIQNFTVYLAALATDGPNAAGGHAFLEFLRTPAAQAILTSNGVVLR